MNGFIDSRCCKSLSDRALLKHEVKSFRIFLRTRRKAGVKNLNSLCRQINTGLRMTFSLSSFDRRSLGWVSCLRSCFRHFLAVFLMVLSTLMIISNSLKIITNLFLRMSQDSWC